MDALQYLMCKLNSSEHTSVEDDVNESFLVVAKIMDFWKHRREDDPTGVQLTPRLFLTSVEEYEADFDDLAIVCCNFNFYGQTGKAYVKVADVSSDDPSFIMVESDGDLHSSFIEHLDEYWGGITKAIKRFRNRWLKDQGFQK